MKEKFFKSKKEIVFTISVLVILASLIGYTYSFFSARIAKENESETILKSNTLGLTFTGIKEINCSNIVPGDECTKTFTVENTSNRAVDFNIYIENVLNEFDADLVYTLKDGDTVVINNLVAPVTKTEKQYIKTKINIESQEIKNYTMTMKFKYTEEDQNINQGKEFKGTVGIDTEHELTSDVDDEQGYYFLNNTNVLQLFSTEKQARTYLLSNYATDYFGEEVTEAKLASGTYQTASGKIITWDKTGKFSDFLENYLKENTEFKGIEQLNVEKEASYDVGRSNKKKILYYYEGKNIDYSNSCNNGCIFSYHDYYIHVNDRDGNSIALIEGDQEIADYMSAHLNEYLNIFNGANSGNYHVTDPTDLKYVSEFIRGFTGEYIEIYEFYERDDSSILNLYNITTPAITDYGYNKKITKEDWSGLTENDEETIDNSIGHLLYLEGKEFYVNIFPYLDLYNINSIVQDYECEYIMSTDETINLGIKLRNYQYRYNREDNNVVTYYTSSNDYDEVYDDYSYSAVDTSSLFGLGAQYSDMVNKNYSFENSLIDWLVGYNVLHK